MEIIKTKLNNVLIVKPKIFEDNRGYFFEAYTKSKYEKLGINENFIQDNISFSVQKYTIRGMHYQLHAKAQSKLIRVLKGEIINVVVDIRKGSPTYAEYIAVSLSAENKHQLYIPKGFANGFVSLTANTEISYKVDDQYSPEHDRSFRWNDPTINIDWPTDNPVLSERDKNSPLFEKAENNFSYEAGS
jgi:dTDP-4-dehydrorhamnose 3,5-epimerase